MPTKANIRETRTATASRKARSPSSRPGARAARPGGGLGEPAAAGDGFAGAVADGAADGEAFVEAFEKHSVTPSLAAPEHAAGHPARQLQLNEGVNDFGGERGADARP